MSRLLDHGIVQMRARLLAGSWLSDQGGELELLCDGRHVGFVRWELYRTRDSGSGRDTATASEISAVADLLADEGLPWRTRFFYNRGAKISDSWLGHGLGAWLYAESARLAWVFSRGGVMPNDMRHAGTTSAAARRVWQSRALAHLLAFDRFRRVAVWADREHALEVPPPDPPGIEIVREYELPLTPRDHRARARPRKNPGRQTSYTPDFSAPIEGMWIRDPGPAWVQHHRALVTAALRSWSGSPAEMKLHLDDAAAGAPMPASGSGKIMRAQAEALAWEITNAPRRSRGTLYRGSHVEPRGVQSWSSRRKVAERWASKNGGRVWTLPPGTPGIRRTDYASTVFDEEAEWLVRLP